MSRRSFPFHSVTFFGLILAMAAVVSPAQPTDNPPPKELLQYVQEAKRSGVKDDKIKQQAMLVGWPAGLVDQALALGKGGVSSPASNTKETAPAAEKAEPAAADAKPAIASETTANTVAEAGGTVGAPKVPDVPQDYQIAAGDTLQITVWKEADVSVPSEIVRPDGKISLPLIKEIVVAGLTPKQIEKVVTEQLQKYYTDANVTVVVTALGPKKVYVTGGVRKEGPVQYTFGMTVMQAISEAGGLTDYAKRKKIYILRTENGRQYRLDFNYDEVVKGVRMDQNYLLVPSDTVVVPN